MFLRICSTDCRRPLQDKFREYLASFARGAKESAKRKNVPVYDLRDYGVRNLIFTGAYIRNGRSYKKAIGELQRLLSVRANILLNNSRHLQLVAITESGALLPSEAAIVDHLLDQDIREIYLLEKSLTDTEKGEFESLVDIAARQDYLASKNSMLFLNNDARKSRRCGYSDVCANDLGIQFDTDLGDPRIWTRLPSKPSAEDHGF